MSLMSSMALALSGTIINVAVPDIMGAFGIGQDLAQWMATAFFSSFTVGLLVSSWAISAFGQKQVFVGMMVFFFFGSIVGGTAQEFNVIIFARAIQGFAAGIILPLTQLAMYRVFGPNAPIISGTATFMIVPDSASAILDINDITTIKRPCVGLRLSSLAPWNVNFYYHQHARS